MRLLIVDDNQQNRYMLQALLTGHNHDVMLAEDGAEALKMARIDPPDLIISDILMPVMDGYALCREWKQDERLKVVPFLFYTATYTDPKDEEFALSLGAERFIVKPQEPEAFMDILNEVIVQHQAGSLVMKTSSVEVEETYFKEYNAVLVRKLENKLLQLELTNRSLAEEIAVRKKVEADLRRFEHIVSNTSDFQAMVNKDYVYLAANEAYLKAFSRLSGEVLGRHVEEVVGEEFFNTVVKPCAERCLAGEDVSYQHWLELPKAESRYIDVAYSPYRGRDNKINGFIVTARDITALKRSEQEQRKLGQAVEQSPESIVITNLDAEIEYVNEAFVQRSGYTQEELVGRNMNILQSGNTPAETFRSLWEALSTGQSWQGELYNRSKDGVAYVEFARISPLSQPDGTITHYVSVQENITEKKRIAEELEKHRQHLEERVKERTIQLTEARRQAEAANHAKSTFLSNMSHEIRTPMNAIIGLTLLLQRAGLGPEYGPQLSKIAAAGGHLLAIINDILDISKIEAGKLTLEHSDFHISTIFDEIQSMLKEQLDAKGLTIEVDQDCLQIWLKGDPTRVRQALLNYIGNAIKFSENSTIFVRTRLLEEQTNDVLVLFEVEDAGTGIEPEKLAALFHTFEQADVSTTRKFGGTGLGLSINRRLAQLMGGEVGVESELGRGSTFWFTAWLDRGQAISLDVASEKVVDAEVQLRTHYKGARILLAEDNAINSEITVALLSSVGLDVDTANDGVEAVKMVRDTAYKLVLMDVQMPDMDGLEATRAIRSMAGREDLPILAMTANVFEEDRRACLDAGMSDFVAKPVELEKLFATIVKWMSDE